MQPSPNPPPPRRRRSLREALAAGASDLKSSLASRTAKLKPSSTKEDVPRPPRYLALRVIEKRAKRQVSIHASPTPANLAKANPQLSCPLFNLLPAETRTQVFTLALSPYLHEGEAFQHPPSTYNYRPDLPSKLATDTRLLLTCRRVWLEANHVPLEQSSPCFWFRDRAFIPEEGTKLDTRPEWVRRIDPENSELQRLVKLMGLPARGVGLVKTVRVFASVEWLVKQAGGLGAGFMLWGRAARSEEDRRGGVSKGRELVLTIRHFDWWRQGTSVLDWGDTDLMFAKDGQLEFSFAGLQVVLNALRQNGIGTLRLELETVEAKVEQLRRIVAQLRDPGDRAWLRPPDLGPHGYMLQPPDLGPEAWVVQDGVGEEVWEGPVEGEWPNGPDYVGCGSIRYRVFTLVWKYRGPEKREEKKKRVVGFGADEPESVSVAGLARKMYQRQWEEKGSLLKFAW